MKSETALLTKYIILYIYVFIYRNFTFSVMFEKARILIPVMLGRVGRGRVGGRIHTPSTYKKIITVKGRWLSALMERKGRLGTPLNP